MDTTPNLSHLKARPKLAAPYVGLLATQKVETVQFGTSKKLFTAPPLAPAPPIGCMGGM